MFPHCGIRQVLNKGWHVLVTASILLIYCPFRGCYHLEMCFLMLGHKWQSQSYFLSQSAGLVESGVVPEVRLKEMMPVHKARLGCKPKGAPCFCGAEWQHLICSSESSLWQQHKGWFRKENGNAESPVRKSRSCPERRTRASPRQQQWARGKWSARGQGGYGTRYQGTWGSLLNQTQRTWG